MCAFGKNELEQKILRSNEIVSHFETQLLESETGKKHSCRDKEQNVKVKLVETHT